MILHDTAQLTRPARRKITSVWAETRTSARRTGELEEWVEEVRRNPPARTLKAERTHPMAQR